MLKITNQLTAAVAAGFMTMEEADNFANFLKRQRSLMKQVEEKISEEAREEEWKKRWSKTDSA